VTVKRVVVGVVLLCSMVGISPARAQTYIPHWDPEFVGVPESSGTVVVTLKMHGPGRVEYQTADGSCEGRFTSPTTTCGGPYARAPGDYGAVSGEVVFTAAGSRQITIPIVNDSQVEGLESFTVWATAGPDKGSAQVWIEDDEGDTGSASETAGAPTSTTTIRRPAPGSGPLITVPPVSAPRVNPPSAPTASPSSDLEVKLASGELRRGPGFELTSVESAHPAADRSHGKDGSAPSLALGVGAAAAVGGVAISARRRRQWSPTQS
jgi:hypothetical protein